MSDACALGPIVCLYNPPPHTPPPTTLEPCHVDGRGPQTWGQRLTPESSMWVRITPRAAKTELDSADSHGRPVRGGWGLVVSWSREGCDTLHPLLHPGGSGWTPSLVTHTSPRLLIVSLPRGSLACCLGLLHTADRPHQ